ncbi:MULTISPECIES: hypothetical protein [Vagococcus]|nr:MULTISPECIES: hypothetical protein [Vagococcus]
MNFKIKHIDSRGKNIPNISKVVLPKALSLTIYQIIKMEVPA